MRAVFEVEAPSETLAAAAEGPAGGKGGGEWSLALDGDDFSALVNTSNGLQFQKLHNRSVLVCAGQRDLTRGIGMSRYKQQWCDFSVERSITSTVAA